MSFCIAAEKIAVVTLFQRNIRQQSQAWIRQRKRSTKTTFRASPVET